MIPILKQSSINIFLINVPNYGTISNTRYQPLGLAYISACASKRGYRCQIIDCNYCDPPMSIEDLITMLSEAMSDDPIIALSATTFSFQASVEIAKKIKLLSSKCTIILGGHHATPMHLEIMKEYSCFDYIIRGEGEYTFCDLLDVLNHKKKIADILGITYKLNGIIKSTPDRLMESDLDLLPFPERFKLPDIKVYSKYYDASDNKEKTTATIITSRGCVANCEYCVDQDAYVSSPKRWRTRSVNNVLEELSIVVRTYNPEHVIFFDACFLSSPLRALKIVEGLHQIDPSITCSFTARVDQICSAEALLSDFRKFGCTGIEIGIESGSDDCLKRFNKGTSVSLNTSALEILKKHRICALIDFIMFEPFMTMDDIRKNLDFLKENHLFGYYPCLLYNRIILYPGSRIRTSMKKMGLTYGSEHSLKYDNIDKSVQLCWDNLLEYMRHSVNLSSMIEKASRSLIQDEIRKEYVIQLNFLIHFSRLLPYIYFENVYNIIREGKDTRNYVEKINHTIAKIEKQITEIVANVDKS